MKSTLTIAGLGAGYFSHYHYDAWQRNPAAQLVAVADIEQHKASSIGAPHSYNHLEAMLAAHKPDILDIVTPPPTHYESIVTACTQYRPAAIICQKPFCRSLDEASAAIKVAADAQVPLIIHENFRFQPWFRTMKKHLSEGKAGQPLQFTFRLRTGDGQGPDAYLDRQPYFRTMPRLLVHETGVHYIDTSVFLFGPVTHVYADIRTLNPAITGEDACFVLLEHASGMRTILDGNRLLDHRSKNNRITFGEALLEGTKSSLTLDGNGCVQSRNFGSVELHTLLEAEEWQGFSGDCVYALQDHVLNALLNERDFENTAAEYLTTLQLVDLVYQSAEKGIKIRI